MDNLKGKNRPISFFLPSLAGGGAERVVLNVAGYISHMGIATDLLVASSKGEYKDKIPGGVRLFDFGVNKPIKAIPKLVLYLHREKPSALLVTITNATIAALLAVKVSLSTTRCIIREASTLSVEVNKSSAIDRMIFPPIIKRLYAQSAAVIAPSHGVAHDLSNLIPALSEKIHVIPNPIISASMIEKSKAFPDHEWFENAKQPIILGIGRLNQQKDFFTLINAFELSRRQRNMKLIILGEGEQRTDLANLIKEKGLEQDVSMPGFVDNPYAYLSNAALFVLSSRWEGLPGVLIEALACGTKVISTDCPSGPGEILDNGRYGQLVPVGDEKAMAAAIDRVLSEKFKEASPEPLIKLYDLEINSKAYLKLLVG